MNQNTLSASRRRLACLALTILLIAGSGCGEYQPLSIDDFPKKTDAERIAGLRKVIPGDTLGEVLLKAGGPDQCFRESPSWTIMFSKYYKLVLTYELSTATLRGAYAHTSPNWVEVNLTLTDKRVAGIDSPYEEVENKGGPILPPVKRPR